MQANRLSKVPKEKKICQSRNLCPVKISFKNENEIKTFQTYKSQTNSSPTDPHYKKY